MRADLDVVIALKGLGDVIGLAAAVGQKADVGLGAAPAELTRQIAVEGDVEVVEVAARAHIGAVDHPDHIGGIGRMPLPDRLI